MRSAVALDRAVNHFSASVTDYHDCSVIVLDGELDALSVPLLQQMLGGALARGHTHLVIDVAKLTFCDSVGIWALAEGHQRAEAAGGRLTLAYVHGVLKRLLEINQRAGVLPLEVEFITTLEW
ncbi:STAS domain-containing protein [Streptosporangium canum]|uniref:STAS domain-containing protein n=1 Tax=Streptosporangium canum TaxID=324952 RepID=UPI00369F272C